MGSFHSFEPQKRRRSTASPSSFAASVRLFGPVASPSFHLVPSNGHPGPESARRIRHSLDRLSILPPEQHDVTPDHQGPSITRPVQQKRSVQEGSPSPMESILPEGEHAKNGSSPAWSFAQIPLFPDRATHPSASTNSPASVGQRLLMRTVGLHTDGQPRVSPRFASQMAQKRERDEAGEQYSVPKKNITGLPDPLKAGVESLSGLSLDDVRVHYNSSKPAEVQALAYTQGTQIHLGPGQKEHLPHEAWHVVQQKQGRVQANAQTKGRAFNNEARLEAEADQMGEMATQGELVPTATQPLPTGGTPARFIQRKIGLEYQTNAAAYKKAPGAKKSAKPVKDESYGKKIYELAGFFHIELDMGDLEFVTVPFDENETGRQRLATTIKYMQTFAEVMREKWSDKFGIDDYINNSFPYGTYDKDAKYYIGGSDKRNQKPTFDASPQATSGIRLEQIPKLMELLAGGSQEAIMLASQAKFNQPQRNPAAQDYIFGHTSKAIQSLEGPTERVRGFAAILISFLRGADLYDLDFVQGKKGYDLNGKFTQHQYPKIYLPLMARNSYRQMFKLLTVEEQRMFKQQFTAEKLLALAGTENIKAHSPIYRAYRGDDGRIYEDAGSEFAYSKDKEYEPPKEDKAPVKTHIPTVKEWLASIVIPHPQPYNKDLLSRMPGQYRERGMGQRKNFDKMRKGNKLENAPIFELRNLVKAVPIERWMDIALLVFDVMQKFNQNALIEQQQEEKYQLPPANAGTLASGELTHYEPYEEQKLPEDIPYGSKEHFTIM